MPNPEQSAPPPVDEGLVSEYLSAWRRDMAEVDRKHSNHLATTHSILKDVCGYPEEELIRASTVAVNRIYLHNERGEQK